MSKQGKSSNTSDSQQPMPDYADNLHPDFGDYCKIEMKRYGVENEIYTFKVVGWLESNSYVNVPVQSPAREVLHDDVVPVVRAIQEGISEEIVLKFRVSDLVSYGSDRSWHVSNPQSSAQGKE